MENRGIKKRKTRDVIVEDCHFQICPIAHNPDLWSGSLCGEVKKSPHVAFLQLRQEVGKKKALRMLEETNYCKMYKYWDECKYGLGGRNMEYIQRKAKSILSVFDSISKKGFYNKSRIQVMKHPLWCTRGFDKGENLRGPEIFHGHHRMACLYVLGIKTVNVDLCKDVMSDTKEWPQKLSRMGVKA